MDPEGVRQIFFAENTAAPEYYIRRALGELPFLQRTYESRFVGVHLPLTRPPPKRLDTRLQQWVPLHSFDTIILCDIDSVVFDADDLLNLHAYVEAGGGLLMLAGPHSFTHGQRHWGALREILPVDYPVRPARNTLLWNEFRQEAPPLALEVEAGDEHPVIRGLTGPWGTVRRFEPLSARPGSAVLARTGEVPLLVAGTFGAGRLVVMGGHPDNEPASVYHSPAWRDALRQTLCWLMQRDADLVVESAAHDAATGKFRLRVGWGAELSESRVTIEQADPGWLAAGLEPRWNLHSEIAAGAGNDFEVGFNPSRPGLYRLRMEVGGELHGTVLRCVRVWELERENPGAPALSFPWTNYTFAMDGEAEVLVRTEGPVRLELKDQHDAVVWSGSEVPAGLVHVPLAGLDEGEYEFEASGSGGSAFLRFVVVPSARDLGLSFVGHMRGSTEDMVQREFDYFTGHGFNATSMGLPAPRDGGGSGNSPLAYAMELAQQAGHRLWGEYERITILSTHGHYGEEASRPTTPCLHDPQHEIQLRALLASKADAARRLPRLVSLEILDEPHILRANVCRCARCLDAYQERYGSPMPTWDAAIAARDGCTRDYFEWLVDYGTRAFDLGYRIWRELNPGVKLHHVLAALGSGLLSANNAIAQDLPWSRSADYIEFDCYNYMYAHWRPLGKLRWNEFHYLMGHFRFLALRNNQPIGFFIQVTDRDSPMTPWDPLRAPSETLYTALGGGAKVFHLMNQGGFTNQQNCREEKFATLGEDIWKVRRAAPLLEVAQPPRRKIAMTFPFHDRLYRIPKKQLPPGHIGLGFYTREFKPFDTLWPNHQAPVNMAELLYRSFGECDVIDQQALRENSLADYGGFVLHDTDYIAPEDAAAVLRFVEQGGALVCDHLPTHNLEGQEAQPLALLESHEWQQFYDDVFVSYRQHGAGRVLLFSTGLTELYTAAHEREDEVLIELLENTIRDFFFEVGLRPHVRSENLEIEANVLLSANTSVIVAVNHGERRETGVITHFHPARELAAVYDLVTMREVEFLQTDDQVEIAVDLSEREGLILGLYAEGPARSNLQSSDMATSRGGRLCYEVELQGPNGQPARGDYPLEIKVTDADGVERPRYGGQRLATAGRFALDEPLAVNAPVGTWRVEVFDRFTRTRQRLEITVQ